MTEKKTVEVLEQRWVHSHEEDTDTEMVFRPASFGFPRSRGRQSFELNSDGSMVELAIGPADSREKIDGTWELKDDDTLVIHRSSQPESKRAMAIVSVDHDRLVIKK